MVKQAVLFVVLAGCVESASTTSQPITPYASDIFLRFGDIQGESKEKDGNFKSGLLSWSFIGDDTGEAGLITNCVDFACHFDLVQATRQTDGDGPTSVWRLASDVPSLGHAVMHGTAADETFKVNLSSGGQEEIALASLLDCHIPPDCGHVQKGTICIPLCTLR